MSPRRLGVAAAALGAVAAGLWLWSRHGSAVWLEQAVAFCF